MQLQTLLPEPEDQAFARVLWRDRDGDGLPSNTSFRGFAFLSLPYPPSADPQGLFKATYLGGQAIQPINGTHRDLQFGESSPLQIISNDLYSLRFAPLVWTFEEVARLFDRLRQWWPGVEQYLRKVPREFVGGGLPQLLLDVLSGVLLNAAGPHAEAVEAFSMEIHQFFQDQGFTIPSARTSLSEQEDPQVLLDGLLGSSADEVSEAAGSAERVLQEAPGQQLSWGPELNQLREALLNRMIFRAHPGLTASVRAVAGLITHGFQLGDEELRQVCLSLGHLANATSALPALPAEQQTARGSVRAAASTLAAALYRSGGQPLQQELSGWAEIGRVDSLLEVRRPWDFLEPQSD